MALHHHSLVAWQRADDLYIHLHGLARQRFPSDERFGLTSQLRRAAYSVVANIVEGFSRQHARERLQFLHTSWGSLAEVGYCLHAARRLGYLDDETFDTFDLEFRRTAAPLIGLIRSQRRLVRSPQRH